MKLLTKPRVLGVDVARFGSAETVVAKREGDSLVGFEAWRGLDTVYSAGRVGQIARDFEAERIMVDDIGVGGGLTDQLAGAGLPAFGVNVGRHPFDRGHHVNLKSELTLGVQNRLRDGEIALCPEARQTQLAREATTLRVAYAPGGKRKIESKEEYVRRVGRSPDYWDALVLAFDDLDAAPLAAFM